MRSIFGKTIFSRIFVINVISVLVCIIILGSMQVVLITNYISRQNEESLGKNADSIVALIQNNIDLGSLRSILSGFSRSSQSHIMVVDDKGSVLVNTPDSGFVEDTPAFINDEYSTNVLAGKRNSIIGTMGGIFSETMFTLQVPVIGAEERVIGAVFISIPIPEQQRVNNEIFRILLFSAIGVILISFLLSYMLAKLFSMPINNIRDSAKKFARGKLDARVGEIATKSDISEIAELAETFNSMAFELEKVEDIRNSFISDVSHELRTPMTTISGFVYGILDDTIPPEKQKEYLKIVYEEVTRLSRLVNTFLDITRIQSDKLEMKKTNFDINEAIRLTIIGLEQSIEKKHIHVTLNFETDSQYVFADFDGIKRVLTNLLDNAIKFTNDGGEISVSVVAKQHDVFVSVRNTGCGIPLEQQRMIFKRLYKVDKSRSTNRDGTGIGLYLVKSIIDAHGKSIKVNSVEGEFAKFMFSLDRGKASSKREEIKEELPPSEDDI